MTIQRTETNDYYFVRKPHGIPTTFGSQFSFLEKIVHEKPVFFAHLAEHFSDSDEYGLLNRLDNDTAGFLYFAKSPLVKEEYKKQQAEHCVNKCYITRLQGKVDIQKTAEKHPELLITHDEGHITNIEKDIVNYGLGIINLSQQDIASIVAFFHNTHQGLTITYPIMHHTHDDIRMVAVRIQKDEHKGRGEKHYVTTTIYPISYDESTNTTLCLVIIHQGMRHQIRVHTSAIGYPVMGDVLYGKQPEGKLQLWSIGLFLQLPKSGL